MTTTLQITTADWPVEVKLTDRRTGETTVRTPPLAPHSTDRIHLTQTHTITLTELPKPVAVDPHAFILLDRSGSMGALWSEAIPSINSFAQAFAAGAPTGKLTVMLFDLDMGRVCVEQLRSAVPVASWRPMTATEASPRGGTPLFDAIGRLVALAETTGATKTSIVIMTDGAENSSRELGRAAAQGALDRCRARGWDVVFLGASWDATNQAAQVGTQASNTMNVSAGSHSHTMQHLGARAAGYSSGVIGANAPLTEQERAAGGWNPSQKQNLADNTLPSAGA